MDTKAQNKKEDIARQEGPDGSQKINKENNVQPNHNSEVKEMDQEEGNKNIINEDQNLEVKDMDKEIIPAEAPV